MKTTELSQTSAKVKASFSVWKKGAVAEQLGMSRNTLKARLRDNCWKPEEEAILKRIGIL